MDKNYIENTLVIGNGFSRTVFEDVASWGNLFEGDKSGIENCTILYETYLLKNCSKKEEENNFSESQ